MLLSKEIRERKMLAWAYAGMWVFVSSFLWSPSRDGVEIIYALAFFIPMLALLPWRKIDLIAYGGIPTVIAVSYATWSVISSIWGSNIDFFVLQWIVLVAWLAGSSLALQARDQPFERLWTWLTVIGAVTALINIFLFYQTHSISERLEGATIARAPTLVGQIYGLAALVAIVQSWRVSRLNLALAYFVASIPAFAAVGLSQSRGPLLALAFAFVVGIIWLRPSLKILACQFVVAVSALVILWWKFPVEAALMERGASFRDQIWPYIWQAMLSDPFTFLGGVGMTQSTVLFTPLGEFHHAHNAWLDILYRTGVIGLGLALVHIACLFWLGFRQPKYAVLVLWLVYGCSCLLVDSRSLFWEIDAKWFMYWIPAGLLAAVLSPLRLRNTHLIDRKL